MKTTEKQDFSIAVIGDGWGAMTTLGLLLGICNQRICWITGSGSQILSPLSSFEEGIGARTWDFLTKKFNIGCGELVSGSFLREYAHKSFREPAEDFSFAYPKEVQFSISAGEVEESLRKVLLEQAEEKLTRITDLVLIRLSQSLQGKSGFDLHFGSGEVISCERVIYADQLELFLKMKDRLLQPKTSLKVGHFVSILQAYFTHHLPISNGVGHSFCALLPKESGETLDRHCWGYFSSDAMRSLWTVELSEKEEESNHEIAKRFRRLKAALDKIFPKGCWFPENYDHFTSTVAVEQFRFEENALFMRSHSMRQIEQKAFPMTFPNHPGLFVISDGFGPSSAADQALEIVSSMGFVTSVKEGGSHLFASELV